MLHRRLRHAAFFNSLRQPLFEFEHCLAYSKPKAEDAAAGLKKIYPHNFWQLFRINFPTYDHGTAHHRPLHQSPNQSRLASPQPSRMPLFPAFQSRPSSTFCWCDFELSIAEWKNRFGVVQVKDDIVEGRPSAVGMGSEPTMKARLLCCGFCAFDRSCPVGR